MCLGSHRKPPWYFEHRKALATLPHPYHEGVGTACVKPALSHSKAPERRPEISVHTCCALWFPFFKLCNTEPLLCSTRPSAQTGKAERLFLAHSREGDRQQLLVPPNLPLNISSAGQLSTSQSHRLSPLSRRRLQRPNSFSEAESVSVFRFQS